jgi:hypothetical protein
LWPRGLPRIGVLDERGREVAGLALVALGVFMGFVIYGGWDGGRLGHGLVVAFGWTLGKARGLAPLALVGAGGMLLLRDSLPLQRSLLGDPRAIGAACLFAGVTLALAAGALGLSSGPGGSQTAWHSAQLQSRGGAFGEALYQIAHRLVQGVGVGILDVFLLLVGVVLITGASLGGALRATGNGVVETTRMMRALGARHAEPQDEQPPGEDFDLDAYAAALPGMHPPEPGVGELVVRATHVEGPGQETDELEAIDPPDLDPGAAHAGDTAAGTSEGRPRRAGASDIADGGEADEDEQVTGVSRVEPG